MPSNQDIIVDHVHKVFSTLPNKSKPRQNADGSREWTTLSGVVLSRADGVQACVSLGTGMRCLPAAKVPLARGRCLHDWHAEMVAIRALNLFLIQECSNDASAYVRRRTQHEISEEMFQPYTIRDDVKIHVYCSVAPCGDASMELTMDKQLDATAWERPGTSSMPSDARSDRENLLHGRGFFSELGVVRRKPARGDAPQTLSKSCSDKLALMQCTSLLKSPASLLLSPRNAYISEFILPEEETVPSALLRAFHPDGRMESLKMPDGSLRSWSGGYAFKPFTIKTTTKSFDFSRQNAFPADKAVGSNISAIWTSKHQETLIGGTIQGKKQFSIRGASSVSKAGLWRAAIAVIGALGVRSLMQIQDLKSYREVKGCGLLEIRRRVKDEVRQNVLRGWIRNDGDEDFSLEE